MASHQHPLLKQLGRFDDEVSRQQALLAASVYQTQAKRLGRTVEDLWQQYPINLTGESAGGQTLNQALAANPPRGWVHSESGEDAKVLGDMPLSGHNNSAVFWTNIKMPSVNTVADAGNYSHSIGADALRHIKEEHGNAKTEANRGQIAISAEDIARIPEVIASSDGIRTDFVSEQG